MHRVLTTICRFVRAEHAQDLIEYAMLVACMAVVAVAAVTTLGQRINTVLWQGIVNNL